MPNWGESAQLLAAASAVCSAILAGLAARASHQNRRIVRQVEVNTNSMREELVLVTRIAALAEGVLRGREEMRVQQRAAEETNEGG